MSATDTSKFRITSIGMVAMNKEMSSAVIKVIPIEVLPMLDGDLASNQVKLTADGVDSQGGAYTSKVTVDNAIEATWLPMSSNRRTPPDVRRGERVLLWGWADSELNYWTELGWDDHLRKLETTIYQWSGTSDESKDSLNEENSYSLEISTHTGQITLKTSKVNGEYCAYALQIDAKNGKVILIDDLGNSLTLDSANTLISFVNALETRVDLDKQKVLIHADDSITLDAKKLIHLTTKDFKMECTTVTVKNDTSTFNTPTTTFTGDVTVNGNITLGGASTFNGAATFNKPITCKGITSTAPIVGPDHTI